MESPGLIWIPRGSARPACPASSPTRRPQWFYWIVGNDQARQPFADEAMADFLARYVTGTQRASRCSTAPLDLSIYRYSKACYYETVYIQGGNVLDELRRRMGGTRFWAGIRDYSQRTGSGWVDEDAARHARRAHAARSRRADPATLSSDPLGPASRRLGPVDVREWPRPLVVVSAPGARSLRAWTGHAPPARTRRAVRGGPADRRVPARMRRVDGAGFDVSTRSGSRSSGPSALAVVGLVWVARDRARLKVDRGRSPAIARADRAPAGRGGSRYKMLVEHVPAAVYIDMADVGVTDGGRLAYMSPQIRGILGFRPEEFVTDPELWPAGCIRTTEPRRWRRTSSIGGPASRSGPSTG